MADRCLPLHKAPAQRQVLYEYDCLLAPYADPFSRKDSRWKSFTGFIFCFDSYADSLFWKVQQTKTLCGVWKSLTITHVHSRHLIPATEVSGQLIVECNNMLPEPILVHSMQPNLKASCSCTDSMVQIIRGGHLQYDWSRHDRGLELSVMYFVYSRDKISSREIGGQFIQLTIPR